MAEKKSRVSGQTPAPYLWDFDGSLAPEAASRGPAWCETFSVGVFQWLPTKSGNGLKRGRVVRRIHGHTSDPEWVYERAREECDRRNREEPDHG